MNRFFPSRRVTRRSFLAGAAAGIAATGVFSIGRARAQNKGRVVILGFDGVEPAIAQEMMDQGQLPNLKRLAGLGAFARLGSTIPPQSPVAWTSFTTCVNPGGHNIFDFIRRDPKAKYGPLPYVGTGKLENPRVGSDGELAELPVAVAYRKGTAFWSVADEQGVRSRIFNVPFAFPPDPLKNGTMLCGLGVPDLRGTTSRFVLLGDSFPPGKADDDVSGGVRIPLTFDGADSATVEIEGPRDERHTFSDPGAFVKQPLTISVDRKAGRGKATVGNGGSVELAQGEWSEWVEWTFPLTMGYAVHGISRFYPLEIGDRVRVYMSCLQFHPEHPYVPMTEPAGFSEDLADRYGLFKTIGWAYDTHALRQDALTEEAFMKDVEHTMSWRERLTLDEIDRGDFDLLVSAWTATDRVGHMFWRYRDPKHPLYDPEGAKRWGDALERTYIKMDEIVGKVMAKLTDDDLLMVLSDHGFESWRTGFSLNSWLQENGYLAVKDPKAAERGFLMGIDWSKTKAYTVGLSSLYLNLQGRESQGIVATDQADATVAELRDKLIALKDPGAGKSVFSGLYTRADYKGEAMDEAPDMSLGYDRYYQSSKAAAKGAVGGELFEPNADKWSGEHAASDAAWIPGVLFCNRPLAKDEPNIIDLGVTALRFLNRDVPSGYEGEGIV